jgi:hypothetical protein
MANSAPITAVTEAVSDAFGNFQPEKIVPDVENFLANLDQVPEAFAAALKKLAGRFEDELPIHPDVTEALREMIPMFNTLAERAREVNATFRSRHEQELNQHHEGRPREDAWNV